MLVREVTVKFAEVVPSQVLRLPRVIVKLFATIKLKYELDENDTAQEALLTWRL
jgi:hypothetical protein